MDLGEVIDDRTFERRLGHIISEFQRRADLLTECTRQESRSKHRWATMPDLLRVMRANPRPMTYREMMEYLPIDYTSDSRWSCRQKCSQLIKRGLIRIHDYIEAYNNIWSPRFVLEEVATGEVGERVAKIKEWFDAEVDNLDSRRMRRACLVHTASKGSVGQQVRTKEARNREIIALRGEGLSYTEIGKRFGISHQRADQIVQRAVRTALTPAG